jgi:hypothetical protein
VAGEVGVHELKMCRGSYRFSATHVYFS